MIAKRQLMATALALIVPGPGHIYAGKTDRGVAILLVTIAVASLLLFGLDSLVAEAPAVVLAGILVAWQAFDAYRAAE